MKSSEEYMEKAESFLLKTYNRYRIVIDRGDGVYLYDTDGKKYLDFAAGIAVFAFGYNNSEYNDALKEQIDKIIHTSNLFYNVPATEAAEKLLRAAGMDRVFFTNSGTEAIEGAIKVAKKYAHKKKMNNDCEIIAMNHSFHGRSLGALSVTGNQKYREPFAPLLSGIKFANFNDLESVKALVGDRTCGIILEPVQGEGGVYPATEEFMRGIRKICDDSDILMICDEVQCGMGRTGKMFACGHYDVRPDVMAVAKALGCGIPVGAFMVRGKAADSLVPGDHGSTYGGNPLATAAVSKVFDMFEKYKIRDNVNNVSEYLTEKLNGLCRDYGHVTEHRGMGLMRGIVFDIPVDGIIRKCMDNGLIVISAGANVIRLVPPLIITEGNVDEMIEIMRKVLNETENY